MKKQRLCDVAGCGRKHRSNGLCNAHYQRKFIHGDLRPEVPLKTPASGDRNPRWKGGQWISDGRVLILMPEHPNANANGYIYRYRLVAEKKIGRLLLPDEIVHHKDTDTMNDDPANLEVMTQSEHAKLHRPENGCRFISSPRV